MALPNVLSFQVQVMLNGGTTFTDPPSGTYDTATSGVPIRAVRITLRVWDSGSKQARRCYVKQWFRFANGRGETAADACSLERIDKAFQKDGRDIKKLILSLTQTDAFLYRQGATQ